MTRPYILPRLPVSVPTKPLPDHGDPTTLKQKWQAVLSDLTEADLVDDAVWRDHFALTGTIRTFYGKQSICTAWRRTCESVRCHDFVTHGEPRPNGPGVHTWLDVSFTFEAEGPPGITGSGSVSLVSDDDDVWKIWSLRTMLEQLKGQPDVDQPSSSPSVSQNGEAGTTSYDCVILGGGQTGLSVGGRLQALGVSYVVLDQHPNVGDSWKVRYDSVKLHTIREFSHLPFERTFGEEYPEWLTKDQLAEAYKRWAEKYNINVWTSTRMLSGSWDDSRKRWTIEIERSGRRERLETSFFVYGAGVNCEIPYMPEYEDRALFGGDVLHSSQYKNAKKWAGKHGVVIGAANTGNDVAEDMVEAGLASVTMIQRSPTVVVPTENFGAIHGRMYNAALETDVSDRIMFLGPVAVGRLMINAGMAAMAAHDPARYDGLERAGFRIDRNSDLSEALFVRLGGHYMDAGACAKIAAGLIKVKSGVSPVRYTADGLEFADGDRIKADVIIFATGFTGGKYSSCSQLFGDAIAERIGDLWGLDEEGELKGAFKPVPQPAFWSCGGGLGQSRFYSRFIALQIKASLLGTPLKLYSETPAAIKYRP